MTTEKYTLWVTNRHSGKKYQVGSFDGYSRAWQAARDLAKDLPDNCGVTVLDQNDQFRFGYQAA